MPKNEDELRCAIKSVLTALSRFHSNNLLHRDIRWSNVLKSGYKEWLLSDWEEADVEGYLDPNTRVDPQENLPPEVNVIGGGIYTAKSDIWCVGQLMRNTNFQLSNLGIEFRNYLCHVNPDERPTALIALGHTWLNLIKIE